MFYWLYALKFLFTPEKEKEKCDKREKKCATKAALMHPSQSFFVYLLCCCEVHWAVIKQRFYATHTQLRCPARGLGNKRNDDYSYANGVPNFCHHADSPVDINAEM